MKKHSCFVISPIGDEGSEIYQEYKDLFELIIVPALEIFDFDVKRGDHFISENKIDDSVIKNIQEADICICDISVPNPNVYYELGRRDETGKPVLLLKKKGTPQTPVDIATRRYFEYEWEGRYAIREAQSHIREFVRPLVEEGFEVRNGSASLADIADSIARIERKLDRMQTNGGARPSFASAAAPTDNSDPVDKLKLAMMQRNIPLAEEAMQQLQYRMDPTVFLDQVVSSVASLGSATAGELLIEKADEFFDNKGVSFKKKVEYLGCLVSFATRKNREEEILDTVHRLCASLELQADNVPADQVVQIYNQQNRLYHGIYVNTHNPEWLDKAVVALKKGLHIYPTNYLFFNLATCYYRYAVDYADQEKLFLSKESIDECLKREERDDKDHLELACRIYHMLEDPNLGDLLERLNTLDPIAAQVLVRSFQ